MASGVILIEIFTSGGFWKSISGGSFQLTFLNKRNFKFISSCQDLSPHRPYQELTLKSTLAILVICSRNIPWFATNYNIKIEKNGIKIQMTVILQLRWHWSPAGGSEDKFSAPCCMSQAPKVLMHPKLLKLKCWFEIHGLEEGSVTPVTALGPLGRSHPLNKRAKLRSEPFWAIT